MIDAPPRDSEPESGRGEKRSQREAAAVDYGIRTDAHVFLRNAGKPYSAAGAGAGSKPAALVDSAVGAEAGLGYDHDLMLADDCAAGIQPAADFQRKADDKDRLCIAQGKIGQRFCGGANQRGLIEKIAAG